MNDYSCPGGPRHKPYTQLCIYCTQLMYSIFNVVIEIKFYSILFYPTIPILGTYCCNVMLFYVGNK